LWLSYLKNNELKIQRGFTTKALLLLAPVPNVQIVQYVQVVQRNHPVRTV